MTIGIDDVVGAIGVTLIVDFNLAAFLVEFFWLAISLYGIYRSFKRTESGPA